MRRDAAIGIAEPKVPWLPLSKTTTRPASRSRRRFAPNWGTKAFKRSMNSDWLASRQLPGTVWISGIGDSHCW